MALAVESADELNSPTQWPAGTRSARSAARQFAWNAAIGAMERYFFFSAASLMYFSGSPSNSSLQPLQQT